MLKITSQLDQKQCVLDLNGELDAETISLLIKEIGSHKNCERFVLNMQFVHYVDTSAIAVLVDLKQRLASQGVALGLATVDDGVKQMFDLAGLKTYFSF